MCSVDPGHKYPYELPSPDTDFAIVFQWEKVPEEVITFLHVASGALD